MHKSYLVSFSHEQYGQISIGSAVLQIEGRISTRVVKVIEETIHLNFYKNTGTTVVLSFCELAEDDA